MRAEEFTSWLYGSGYMFVAPTLIALCRIFTKRRDNDE